MKGMSLGGGAVGDGNMSEVVLKGKVERKTPAVEKTPVCKRSPGKGGA